MTGASGMKSRVKSRVKSEAKEACTDFRHIVGSSPLGVLTARSAADVQELISFAGPHGLPVSARGAGALCAGGADADRRGRRAVA
ncbi:hypothetical protein [Streptomyces regalis]|uniref:hypothetical protein n=1 Tax=Streptomyces regalis TaxID=68262 RepID=UPI000AD71F3E|nr:hypothetical protein [Streptomyces regalis]